MTPKIVSTLVAIAILAECTFGLYSHYDPSTKMRERRAEFKNTIDELWERQTKEGPPRHSIDAPSFGDGTTMIVGKEMETYHERTIYAFQGLRYAHASRFMLPEAEDYSEWEEQDLDEYHATHIGAICPQLGMISGEPAGSEDCLFLNVYTPMLPEDIVEPLPVMLFIHGGGFISGDSSYYMPTRLLDHDVILVTIHYRLGTLGFFFTNNDDAPGNYALYDQVKSLEWVQEHIADFGGDPSKVTVFGESAGGVSASYMQFVPPAEGLARGIISQSGSSIDVWSLDLDPVYATNYISNYVGCGSNETIDMVCMREADWEDLVWATMDLVSTDRQNGLMGFRGVSPTVQGENVTINPILTQTPSEYFQKRELHDIPQMMGTNKHEGSFVLGVMYNDFLVPNNLEDNSTYMEERMVADLIEAMGVFDVSNSLAESCTLLYCPDIDMADFVDRSSYCLIDMSGALFLKAGAWETANLLSYFGTQKVYVYSFDYPSEDSMAPWIIGDVPFETGITHSDELMYLFSMPAVINGTQELIMDRLTYLWTNFAMDLDPTPTDKENTTNELGIPHWDQYMFEDYHYILMEEDFTMQENFLLRWTVTVDDITEQVSASPTTAEATMTSTTTAADGDAEPDEEEEDYQDDYNEALEEAIAYLAGMLFFIIAFCIACMLAVYFFFKARG